MKQAKSKAAANSKAQVTNVAPAEEPHGAESPVATSEGCGSQEQGMSTEAAVVTSPAMAAEGKSKAHMHALPASCTVRDCLTLKSALLDLLAAPNDVTIDARAVERVDTAALQVLTAFMRDRRAASGTVTWLATPGPFAESVRLLGLQNVLGLPADLMTGGAE